MGIATGTKELLASAGNHSAGSGHGRPTGIDGGKLTGRYGWQWLQNVCMCKSTFLYLHVTFAPVLQQSDRRMRSSLLKSAWSGKLAISRLMPVNWQTGQGGKAPGWGCPPQGGLSPCAVSAGRWWKLCWVTGAALCCPVQITIVLPTPVELLEYMPA